MNTKLMTTTLCLFAGLTANEAFAQSNATSVATVPFAFSTSRGEMPAGTYRIKQVYPNVVQINNANHSVSQFISVTPTGRTSEELGTPCRSVAASEPAVHSIPVARARPPTKAAEV